MSDAPVDEARREDEARDEEVVTDDQGRRVVDARGMPCPRPVIELAAAVKQVAVGAEVLLLADDPAADVDVPVWCRMQRQELVSQVEDDGVLRFVVAKRRDI